MPYSSHLENSKSSFRIYPRFSLETLASQPSFLVQAGALSLLRTCVQTHASFHVLPHHPDVLCGPHV